MADRYFPILSPHANPQRPTHDGHTVFPVNGCWFSTHHHLHRKRGVCDTTHSRPPIPTVRCSSYSNEVIEASTTTRRSRSYLPIPLFRWAELGESVSTIVGNGLILM